jgi:hypothetical protein
MFVAWLDTDTTVSSENNAPDIWCRGIDLPSNSKSTNDAAEDRPDNVTFGSEATFSAYFFAMGNEVFENEEGDCTIPFVYENMTPTDPVQPVQFKYIQNYIEPIEEFWLLDIPENSGNHVLEVSQPVPNPVINSATINLTLRENAFVNVQVTNLMGQTVIVLPTQIMQAGVNTVNINVANLTSGVYFYTVEAGKEAVTKKMIIK